MQSDTNSNEVSWLPYVSPNAHNYWNLTQIKHRHVELSLFYCLMFLALEGLGYPIDSNGEFTYAVSGSIM